MRTYHKNYRVTKHAKRVRLFTRITPSELQSLVEDRMTLMLAVELVRRLDWSDDVRTALRLLRKMEREIASKVRTEFLLD